MARRPRVARRPSVRPRSRSAASRAAVLGEARIGVVVAASASLAASPRTRSPRGSQGRSTRARPARPARRARPLAARPCRDEPRARHDPPHGHARPRPAGVRGRWWPTVPHRPGGRDPPRPRRATSTSASRAVRSAAVAVAISVRSASRSVASAVSRSASARSLAIGSRDPLVGDRGRGFGAGSGVLGIPPDRIDAGETRRQSIASLAELGRTRLPRRQRVRGGRVGSAARSSAGSGRAGDAAAMASTASRSRATSASSRVRCAACQAASRAIEFGLGRGGSLRPPRSGGVPR